MTRRVHMMSSVVVATLSTISDLLVAGMPVTCMAMTCMAVTCVAVTCVAVTCGVPVIDASTRNRHTADDAM
ncbi:MAG: hypothetical protein KVP17_002697 [Porospora cf. gigantea B]|uniref:uncharacterized protein n=1 Tax=Porospora cf. gigantea B TaxID=2853592 RepID=UPI0035718A9D|nr:MAG: hypothetical protein KVP17_002697 [Porospora cf. gigantea B]